MARLITVVTKEKDTDMWLRPARACRQYFSDAEFEIVSDFYFNALFKLPGVIPDSIDSYVDGNVVQQSISFDTEANALNAQKELDPTKTSYPQVVALSNLMKAKMQLYGITPYRRWTKVLP
jgi:hypothetical protein